MNATNASRRLALLPVIVASVIVAGCASDPPPRDAFYTLAPLVTPRLSAQPLPATILVNRLAARGFTGGRRIVFRDEAHPLQVQRYHYLYWAEAPAVMVQDRLTRALRDAGIADYVITPAERARADWILSGSLLRMEHHPDAQPPEVALEIELSIVNAACRTSVFMRRYSVHEPAPTHQIDQAIAAFDRAMVRLTGEFLEDARSVLSKPVIDAPACR